MLDIIVTLLGRLGKVAGKKSGLLPNQTKPNLNFGVLKRVKNSLKWLKMAKKIVEILYFS